MHPASISTRAAATQGGARAAAVVHGVVVDRRSVGCREGWLCPAFALPSIHSGESTYLKSQPSSSPRWLVGGLSSMAPRTRKSGKAVLAGGVGWWPELLGHGDGRWRRRPQGVKGRGEDEMKRGGRGRRRAHGEAPPGADLVVGGKKATPSSTSVRSPKQLYCCNIQKGSLHSFSVLQEKVHKKQHSASQKLQSLLAIEQIHS